MFALAPLGRVTPLSVDPGARVVLRGTVRTSVDGSVFDALALFDPAAGGLRLAGQHPDRQEYVLAPTGGPGPACVAAGEPSPCLAPRLAELAHERLRTGAELASTLSGRVELEATAGPAIPPAALRDALTGAVIVGVVAVVVALLAAARRLARSPMGRVRAAAREATRATRGDATLQRLRGQVSVLLARATQLDVARRACLRRLRRIDRAALAKRVEARARSTAPGAADALEWLTAERAEATRLESDVAASLAGLERIESALRVMALRARAHRGVSARTARADPVDTVAAELALRDEGLAEVDRFVGR